MFNLLPFEQKKAVRREYRKRVMILALLTFILAEAIALILLVPTIILNTTEEKDFVERQDQLSKQVESGESGSLSLFLKHTTEKLNELSPQNNPARPADTFVILASKVGQGIHLRSVTYKTEKDYFDAAVTVEGRADNREALLSYRKILEAEPSFSKVTLPISNFTQESDIPFTITLVAVYAERPTDKDK